MKVADCRGIECDHLQKTYCTVASEGHIRVDSEDKVHYGHYCQIRYLRECPKNLMLTDGERDRIEKKRRIFESGTIIRSAVLQRMMTNLVEK